MAGSFKRASTWSMCDDTEAAVSGELSSCLSEKSSAARSSNLSTCLSVVAGSWGSSGGVDSGSVGGAFCLVLCHAGIDGLEGLPSDMVECDNEECCVQGKERRGWKRVSCGVETVGSKTCVKSPRLAGDLPGHSGEPPALTFGRQQYSVTCLSASSRQHNTESAHRARY